MLIASANTWLCPSLMPMYSNTCNVGKLQTLEETLTPDKTWHKMDLLVKIPSKCGLSVGYTVLVWGHTNLERVLALVHAPLIKLSEKCAFSKYIGQLVSW